MSMIHSMSLSKGKRYSITIPQEKNSLIWYLWKRLLRKRTFIRANLIWLLNINFKTCAVECGVREVIPFESSRCIVRAKPEAEGRKTERRCRIAEEAAKQCGRGVIPTVKPTVTFSEALKAAEGADLVLFCYEGAAVTPLPAIIERAAPALDAARAKGRTPEIAIFVGSEGGFSPEEAEAASARGFAMTGLGKRILRTETASGFVLSCLIYALEL